MKNLTVATPLVKVKVEFVTQEKAWGLFVFLVHMFLEIKLCFKN